MTPGRFQRISSLVVLLGGTAAALAILQPVRQPAAPPAPVPAILLADASHAPRVTVSWPTRGGAETRLEGERKYQSPGEKSNIGGNIECYVALGGTRIDKGAGNSDGAVVRVGLYKADPRKPFFADLADDASITIRLDGIRMNQPAAARPKTALMHLRYMPDDLASCGISQDGRNLFITASKDDKVLKAVGAGSVRPGELDGVGAGHGSVTSETGEDGSISVTFKFPYALLRHVKDPSKREAPGGFFEPQHFHCEIELMPAAEAPKDAAPIK